MITTPRGDELLAALSALANPHRLRVIAVLSAESQYVSQLARTLGLSRPLLHMHLQRLQAAGLITDRMEINPDGKAIRWVSVTDFGMTLNPESIADAVRTLTDSPSPDGHTKGST